jgi:hypothetical protein
LREGGRGRICVQSGNSTEFQGYRPEAKHNISRR